VEAKIIRVEDAVGTVLSHDLTLIDPDSGYKGARFKRGHTVTRDDMEVLRRMGRERLSILKLDEGEVHEDDAALRLAAALSFPREAFSISGPSEGKCVLTAQRSGLLSFGEEAVHKINEDANWVFATLPNKVPVSKGETVAAWRVAPLVAGEDSVRRAELLAPFFDVREFRPLRTALVTTGREIWEGRVRDAFSGKLEKKLAFYGAPLMGCEAVPDDRDAIRERIEKWASQGAEVILCSGGMSVDADDLTPAAIRDAATEVVFRWTPVLPGSNLMLAKRGNVILLGVPACAVHADVTVLDSVMRGVYAGLIPSNEEIRRWGVGGLCRGCSSCGYPVCAFGSRP
jgi:molybdenum cofactor synthesis domain-containing protein